MEVDARKSASLAEKALINSENAYVSVVWPQAQEKVWQRSYHSDLFDTTLVQELFGNCPCYSSGAHIIVSSSV